MKKYPCAGYVPKIDRQVPSSAIRENAERILNSVFSTLSDKRTAKNYLVSCEVYDLRKDDKEYMRNRGHLSKMVNIINKRLSKSFREYGREV